MIDGDLATDNLTIGSTDVAAALADRYTKAEAQQQFGSPRVLLIL